MEDILNYPNENWRLYRTTEGVVKTQRKATESQPALPADQASSLCVICCENPRDLVFMKCNHCVTCKVCFLEMLADRLEDWSIDFDYPPCPLCRIPAEKCMKVIL